MTLNDCDAFPRDLIDWQAQCLAVSCCRWTCSNKWVDYQDAEVRPSPQSAHIDGPIRVTELPRICVGLTAQIGRKWTLPELPHGAEVLLKDNDDSFAVVDSDGTHRYESSDLLDVDGLLDTTVDMLTNHELCPAMVDDMLHSPNLDGEILDGDARFFRDHAGAITLDITLMIRFRRRGQ